ncbi:MAG: putative nucleic acid-binding Zn-ribbon protein [Cyclobacteriaceae bacterium]|jgi:predicted  nucleic acid-binding Zn-ribbon protein
MENTVAQRLETLSKLQSIDSELDEIEKIRGALPEEVMDLEDEIVGYETRVANHNQQIEDLELSITNNKTSIKDSEKLIEKYKEQQMNVRNNREYDAITKEMELQELEIQIQEKRIKESHVKIEVKNEEIQETINTLEERKKDLVSKKKELETISSESQDEEEKLMKGRAKASKVIEERLLNSYNKIRNNVRNRLAVVPVDRGACGGCFNVVPPQKQAEIREKKKLIVCEHCGRILSDVIEEVIEEVVKPKRTKRTTKAK